MVEQQKDLFNDNLITVGSMNPKSKGTFYVIDRAALTCSCPAFKMGMTRPCKHMKAVLPPATLDKVESGVQSYSLDKAKKKGGYKMGGLYTVGHSNYTAEYLINKLLKPHGITTVVDVRSVPYSRYNGQFNRPDLAASLYKANIRYFYGGKYLGGKGKGCPSIESAGFKTAINKVIELAQTENVVLMCSERNPAECHRAMKLTAYTAHFAPGLKTQHITKEGLVDALEFETVMPKQWFWHEFGGTYTAG